jgi:hypothetical protein
MHFDCTEITGTKNFLTVKKTRIFLIVRFVPDSARLDRPAGRGVISIYWKGEDILIFRFAARPTWLIELTYGEGG